MKEELFYGYYSSLIFLGCGIARLFMDKNILVTLSIFIVGTLGLIITQFYYNKYSYNNGSGKK